MLNGISLFYVLNEAAPIQGADASPTITLSNADPTQNDLKLMLVNATGKDQIFVPAVAPSAPGTGSASTIYLQIVEQTPAENNAIKLVAARSGDWAIAGFDELIGLCPTKPFVLGKAHDATNPYVVHLTHIAVANGHAAGTLNLNDANCPAALGWLQSDQGITYTSAGTPVPDGFYVLELTDAATAGALLNITNIVAANRLQLTLINGPSALTANADAAFNLTFSYGPWSDDIAPESLFDHVAIAPEDATWTCAKTTNTSWVLRPPPGTFLAANAEYRFLLTGLLTELDPAQEGNICYLTVANRAIAGYTDGGVRLALTKGYYATIATFVLESKYEGDNNKHEVCTGVGNCSFFAGDTVDISWQTCGSDPKATTPCSLLLGTTTLHAGAAQDDWSWNPASSHQQQMTLICEGKGAAGAYMKQVTLATKPPEIHAFTGAPHTAGSPVIQMNWSVRGVTMKITLSGTGIDAPIDVTARTVASGGVDQLLSGCYLPPTTTGYPGGNYSFTLTCDDGFNPPETMTCSGPVVAITDITSVAYPVPGGIALWLPGNNPAKQPSPGDSSLVTDITTNICQVGPAGFTFEQLMINWSTAAGQVNGIYAGMGSSSVPSTSVSYAQAGKILCSVVFDLSFNPVLLYQTPQQPAAISFAGAGLPLTPLNISSRLPLARIRHLPFINGELGIGPLGDSFWAFADIAIGMIVAPCGSSQYSTTTSNMSPIVDVAGGPVSESYYSVTATTDGYSIYCNTFNSNGQDVSFERCGNLVNFDTSIMSLTLDTGLTAWTITQKYLYWLEKIPGQTEHMLCRCIKEGGDRGEVAVLTSDPSASGLAVVGPVSF
ncbi:hypothetical protein [Sphingomonas sp. GB1N7]|uniref:hypothetical protein n=1 Tax=Parasphingomonas caseinilytica TaxID=3096158 RepID=UPI002FCA20D9